MDAKQLVVSKYSNCNPSPHDHRRKSYVSYDFFSLFAQVKIPLLGAVNNSPVIIQVGFGEQNFKLFTPLPEDSIQKHKKLNSLTKNILLT